MKTEAVTTLKRQATKLLAVQQGQTLDMQQAKSQMNKWLE